MNEDQGNNEAEIDCEDLDFSDAPKQLKKQGQDPERPSDPIIFLPYELQDAARKLPIEQAHTVLELREEGEGHNESLLSVAAICYKMGVPFNETLEHLNDVYDFDRVDYDTAPTRAVERVWFVEGDVSKIIDSEADSMPKAKDEMLLRFRRMSISHIKELSPGNCKTPAMNIIADMFDEKDIINIQATAFESGTLCTVKELPEFIKTRRTRLEAYKFLNPSTFKKVEGVPNTKNKGKITTRCNDNVKARRYMVLEMDTEDIAAVERFSTFAITLGKFAKLVLAVETGNKSIHFWYDTKDVPAAVVKSFFAQACLHGADPRLAVKSQIARMPNVSAAKEGRGPQKVVYYDPEGEAWPTDGWDLKGFEKHLVTAKHLDFYYMPGSSFSYYTRDDSERWIAKNRTSLLDDLALKGFRANKIDGDILTPAAEVIQRIESTRAVEAVMSGCSGRHSGYYEENGQRFLVTKSPTFIKERKGHFPTIKKFLKGLLIDEKQYNIFLAWLSQSVKDLRNDGKRIAHFSQAQALHVCGPANSGKTLLLKNILTPALGGRAASADPYFRERAAEHNQEMFEVELCWLDDTAVLKSNYQSRQEHGERLKSMIVGGGSAGYRKMRQDRLAVRPWWRLVRFLNEDPHHLATLPLLDDGVEDKWILLKSQCLSAHWPESNAITWYPMIEKKCKEEMAAFLHFLIHEYEKREEDLDLRGRYGVESYKHEEILSAIAEGSPEQYLKHRFDNDCNTTMFGDDFDDTAPLNPWQGSADSLYELLMSTGSRVAQQRFQKICPNPKVLLAQLRQMEKEEKPRVFYSERREDIATKSNGSKYWYIEPPKPLKKESDFMDEI